jgi:hypothetical protein
LAAKKPKVDDDAVDKKKPDAAKKTVPVDEPSTSMAVAPVAQAAPNAPLPVPVAVQQELPPIKPTEVSSCCTNLF